MALDKEPGWLIALISDTGIRLTEACGLQASDIHLDGNMPYIDLVERPWRRLKTSSSSIQVPLVEIHCGQHSVSKMQILPLPSPNTAAKASATPTLQARH